MLKEDEIYTEETQDIEICCPKCHIEKSIKVPSKIIETSLQLITISIPINFMCEHGFQAYIDKHCAVRGYQSTDYELEEFEIYETGSKPYDGIITHKLSVIIKNVVDYLIKTQGERKILGGTLFFEQGTILYLSLPNEIFLGIIRQVESLKKSEDINLRKSILVLEDHRKIFTEHIYVEGTALIMAILYPASLELNQCNINQDEALDHILNVEDLADKRKKEQDRLMKIESAKKKQIIKEAPDPSPPPSPYWIYAEVSNPGALAEVARVDLATFENKIDKKHILNLDQIVRYKDKIFKGKLYFDENYVRLMEGLALTIKDAAAFLSQLNKMPE